MKIKLFTIIGLVLTINARAQNLSQECINNPMMGHFYRQQNYSINSHDEDLMLASLGNRYAESLLSVLKIREINNDARENAEARIVEQCAPFTEVAVYKGDRISDQDDFISEDQRCELIEIRREQNKKRMEEFNCEVDKIVRKSPIRVKEFNDNFKAIISEYETNTGVATYKSPPHKWSKQNKKELIKKFPAAAVMSKLLTSLAIGASARFMMTEQDFTLREWIKSQPMASLLPEDVFRKSLELQKGDVYKALLSVENVLSEYWLAKNRENLKQTSALLAITNTCNPNKEDVFGSWYHLFGTMLLGCVKGPVISNLVGRTESLGGRILDIGDAKKQGHNLAFHLIVGSDPQEEKINRKGGRIGHLICKDIPMRPSP